MPTTSADVRPATGLDRFLNFIERAGNKLPNPAILFVGALFIVWVASALLSGVAFSEIDPRSSTPIRVRNLLTGAALAEFLSNMVTVFVTFPPLGIVLVALLGVGVAEHVGFLTAMLKGLLNITPLMPYFPLTVVFCQRYVRNAGIGTLASMMLPYSATFLVAWTLYLLAYWALGLPLGLQSTYTHP